MEETETVTATRILALGSIAAALAVGAACAPYEPLPRAQTAILPGVHATAACADCHGAGPPYYAFVWDTTCISCHEADRKPPLPPAVVSTHYVGQGCASQDICHAAVDPAWNDRDGVPDDTSDTGGGTVTGYGHEFLPLEGGHPTDCTACHTDGVGSSSTVFPEGGTPDLCWSCHEEDRYGGDSHYVYDEEDTTLPDGAELRRDCKACHDVTSRTGAPFASDWSENSEHGGIRFPHGMEDSAPPSFVPIPQSVAAYITDCAACHPTGPPAYQCTVACHEEIYATSPHTSYTPGSNDSSCTLSGCHPSADIRHNLEE